MALSSLSPPAYCSRRPIVASSNERQALFSRIAPAYDNVRLLTDILLLQAFSPCRDPSGPSRSHHHHAPPVHPRKLASSAITAFDLFKSQLSLPIFPSDLVIVIIASDWIAGYVGPSGLLDMLDSRSPHWQRRLNDLLSLGQHRIWKRMAVSWSGARRGDLVLDVCCGSGDLAFLLSEKVGFEGQVTGLDFSREQLSIASARQASSFWKACYKNIMWIEGNALDLPFPECSFDAITIGYGLRNVVDKPAAMKEEWIIDNVVVPAASNYGLEKEYAYLKSSIENFLTGDELEKLAKDVGFSKARHYEIGGGLMGTLVATR
ncbi:hypothetical protein ACLOJK_001929 [Asimina triloba]